MSHGLTPVVTQCTSVPSCTNFEVCSGYAVFVQSERFRDLLFPEDSIALSRKRLIREAHRNYFKELTHD